MNFEWTGEILLLRRIQKNNSITADRTTTSPICMLREWFPNFSINWKEDEHDREMQK